MDHLMEYNNWLKNRTNKPINDDIDKILQEEKCYNSSDDIIRALLNSLCELEYCTLDEIIRNKITNINKKLCNECEYIIDNQFDKNILQCINCKYVNQCNECLNIHTFNYKYKFNRLNKKESKDYCNVCHDEFIIDMCNFCNNYKCTCGCPKCCIEQICAINK
jgi:hypothetical protein